MNALVILGIILLVVFIPIIIAAVREGQHEKVDGQIAHKKRVIEDLTNKIKRLEQLHKDKQEEIFSILSKKQYCEKELEKSYKEIDKAQERYEKLIKKNLQTLKKIEDIKVPSISNCNAIVGIDFEYLITGRQDTPCQVGLAVVVDNVIVLRYSSLIQVPDTIEGTLSYGNGITREMVKNAPTFSEIIKVMESICKDAIIVSHNKSTEQSVLKKACALYKIDSWLTSAPMEDTCKLMGGKGLQECCAEHNIPLNHHDALSDAEACAKLYLIHNGRKVVEEQVRIFGKGSTVDNSTSDVYKPLSDDQVENKNTPFFGGVKTVVTGTFTNFPDRAVLKEKLKALGADIDTTVTKRTKILVTGSGCGPKKLETAQEYGVRIMNETEVLKYIQ